MKTWKPCTVRGCTDRHLARGMCASHYQRWKRTGVLEAFVVVDPKIVRLRRLVGIPDDGPTVEQRERWHRQEAQGEDLMVTAWLARKRVA